MRRAACCAALTIVLLAAAPAAAQEPAPGSAPSSNAAGSAAKPAGGLPTVPGRALRSDEVVPAPRGRRPPPGRRLTTARAGRIADRLALVRGERRRYPGATREVFLKGPSRWQVSYFAKVPPGDPRKEVAQVTIDDRSGAVLEAYKDYKVAWTMARGYPGAFGRIVNSPLVWVPLAVLFVLPFLHPRRPRMLHLDLLVLSAFSISLACFNAAEIAWSVPLVYPLLAYLLGRMLWIGLRPRTDLRRPVELLVPVSWLAIAVVFLLGFRVALNVTRSNVIDVGYAGVIGADRFVDGRALYGAFPDDNHNGDTYGPAVYAAYVPFEQALSWSGSWDDLPAAHAAAITFDLLACLLCFLLGRRVRGPDLGIVLAYAWVTFPFTLYASMSNANDALVATLVLAALLVASSPKAGRPVARGGMIALAGLTKFAPLALAPLYATFTADARRRWPGWRAIALFAGGFALMGALAFVPVLAHNDLRSFWDASIAFQAQRGSPFSVWGLYEGAWLDRVQLGVQVAAVAGALVLAVVPRRRDVVGLAALSAAILIALQLGVTHWFYLYIPWFFPLVMIALLGRCAAPVRVALRA